MHTHMCIGVEEFQWAVSTQFQSQKILECQVTKKTTHNLLKIFTNSSFGIQLNLCSSNFGLRVEKVCQIFPEFSEFFQILFAFYTSHSHVHMHIGSWSYSEVCRLTFSLRRYLVSCYIHIMHTHVYRCLGASVRCVDPPSASESSWAVLTIPASEGTYIRHVEKTFTPSQNNSNSVQRPILGKTTPNSGERPILGLKHEKIYGWDPVKQLKNDQFCWKATQKCDLWCFSPENDRKYLTTLVVQKTTHSLPMKFPKVLWGIEVNLHSPNFCCHALMYPTTQLGVESLLKIFWNFICFIYLSQAHAHALGIKKLQWGVSTNFQPQKVFGELLYLCHAHTLAYRCLGASVSCGKPIPVSEGILWVVISMSRTHTYV